MTKVERRKIRKTRRTFVKTSTDLWKRQHNNSIFKLIFFHAVSIVDCKVNSINRPSALDFLISHRNNLWYGTMLFFFYQIPIEIAGWSRTNDWVTAALRPEDKRQMRLLYYNHRRSFSLTANNKWQQDGDNIYNNETLFTRARERLIDH